MSWPTTPDRVISRARKDLGLGESPNGSNHNRITVAYGIGDGAWCAMAVWFWFRPDVDLRKEITSDWAYTPSGVNGARAHGLWHPGHAGIRKGDVVFYKTPDSEGSDFVNHVGIVTGVPSSTTVRSIEGNTANIVAERIRPVGWIVGYMRPPYAGAGTPKPTPAAPPFPGTACFQLGKTNPAVTMLDRQLVRLGYTRHNDGNGYQPGPRFTTFTRDNVRDFQEAQGWSGDDADGYPGPETWRRLFTTRAGG
ncbi:peptidoglycan-binding protein [Streptomyces sp. NPDC100445]|uniref:peptidoglycan-binding protein n=1 Tax=Streptomyces sp. NPDC100445 TaxID=3366102 RepID=UPI003816804F